MNQYEPKEHEQLFGVRPIGVRYICEFCNEGEMRYITPTYIIAPNALGIKLYKHQCSKCGKIMELPKMYPYIEWSEITQKEVIEETMGIVKDLHTEFEKLREEKETNLNEAN